MLKLLIDATKRIVGWYPLYYDYRIKIYCRKLSQDLDKMGQSQRAIAKLLILQKGYIVSCKDYDFARTAKEKLTNSKLPMVSAMLITKDRPDLAWRAVEAFLEQSYHNKELVVIDEGGTKLQQKLESLGSLEDHNIVYHRNNQPCTLGELRNLAVETAKGSYVCQWDDDDLYHKDRLAYQLISCLQSDASACFLLRQMILQQGQQEHELAISSYRLWEGTIMARKNAITKYPHMARAEDTPVVKRLVLRHKIVALDLPELYIYNIHGDNTWGQSHMQKMLGSASMKFSSNQERIAKLNSLRKFYPQQGKHLTY